MINAVAFPEKLRETEGGDGKGGNRKRKRKVIFVYGHVWPIPQTMLRGQAGHQHGAVVSVIQRPEKESQPMWIMCKTEMNDEVGGSFTYSFETEID